MRLAECKDSEIWYIVMCNLEIVVKLVSLCRPNGQPLAEFLDRLKASHGLPVVAYMKNARNLQFNKSPNLSSHFCKFFPIMDHTVFSKYPANCK